MTTQTAATTYFRLRANGLERHQEDDFATACFAIGAGGVVEDLKFAQQDLCYEPDVIETPVLDLNVYFETAPAESALLALQGQFPKVRFERSEEENKDWLAEWKKGFVPFRFAGDFWVVPSWLKPPAEAPIDPRLHIYVEPGMAFGTGTHETTRLAAGLIIELFTDKSAASVANAVAAPRSVLDVGTGTGILAVIAYRLGAGELVGIDVDAEARRTARENLELNHAEAIVIDDRDLKDITATYDVVIANIIDGILMLLKEDLVRVLAPGGRMVLSGVLREREAAFYRDFCQAMGLRVIKQVADGEWSAALLERA